MLAPLPASICPDTVVEVADSVLAMLKRCHAVPTEMGCKVAPPASEFITIRLAVGASARSQTEKL